MHFWKTADCTMRNGSGMVSESELQNLWSFSEKNSIKSPWRNLLIYKGKVRHQGKIKYKLYNEVWKRFTGTVFFFYIVLVSKDECQI